jgi:hypothetical protein
MFCVTDKIHIPGICYHKRERINLKLKYAVFESIQASPACPSGNSGKKMKIIVERSWRANDNGIKVKVKVKFTLEQATKAQKGSRCTSLLFFLPRR